MADEHPDRPEPVDLANGETTIDPAEGADDADRARRQAELVEEHSRESDDPPDPAATRPDPGPSTPANGPG